MAVPSFLESNKVNGKNKYHRAESLMQEDALQPPITCSLFALGAVATYESLLTFERTVLFLIQKHHVTRFNITKEYCHSGYMYVLKNLSQTYKQMHLIAITHFPEIASMTREEWRNAASPHCPPCHAVENIDTHTSNYRAQVIRATKQLIEQSNFCICNLKGNPLAENIIRHIAKETDVGIIDISRQYIGFPDSKEETMD